MKFLFFFLCMLFCFTTGSQATTFLVLPDGSGDQPTIAAAVAMADSGDVIRLVAGTYIGPGNCNVVVGKTLSVLGLADRPEDCVIDCQGSPADPKRAFDVEPPQFGTFPTLTLEGVTLTNGYAPGDTGRGGAIRVGDSGHLMARHCIFSNNRAYRGGAIGLVCPGGTNQVWFSTFRNNGATDSGAVGFSDNITSLRLYWCTIVDNEGPGVFGVYIGYCRLENCTVVGNSVGNTGGVFQGSDSGWGGYGVFNTIVAHNDGRSFEDTPDLTAAVECSDFYNNTGGDWSAAPLAGLLGTNGNFQAAPRFCDLAGRDLRLEEASPCGPGAGPGGLCELIGAQMPGCTVVQTQTESLGSLKALFRTNR